MAKRKSSNGDSQYEPLIAVVEMDVATADMSEVTNINATLFCPHIQHKKDYMPRRLATCIPYPNDYYHWWQRKDFTNVQFCKLKRTPEDDFEKCWKHFAKCEEYLDALSGKK